MIAIQLDLGFGSRGYARRRRGAMRREVVSEALFVYGGQGCDGTKTRYSPSVLVQDP